jgi:hypothetical protein
MECVKGTAGDDPLVNTLIEVTGVGEFEVREIPKP